MLSLALFGVRGAIVSDATAVTSALNGPNPTALPLGDSSLTTAGPETGKLFGCRPGNPNAPGSNVNGPWIKGATYDLTAKAIVDGSNAQPAAVFRAKVKKAFLKLNGNGLPTNHGTGNFPISPSDGAFAYDKTRGGSRPR